MQSLEELALRVTDYLPAFFRVTSFLMLLPFLGRNVPALAKLGLGALLTALIAPAITVPQLGGDVARFFLISVEEVLVGLAMGLIVTTVMMAVYLAGQLIDVPMGFGMVNVMDPQMGSEAPVVAQFYFAIALLTFFLIDGHHGLLRALVQSFDVVPLGGATLSGGVPAIALDAVRSMFSLGLKIALPVIGALFLTDVALGIVARAVPQINVFFVGFPLKVGLGMLLLAIVMPAFVGFIAEAIGPAGEIERLLTALVRALDSGR